MGYAFTPADVEFLRSPQGVRALDSLADLALTARSYLSDVAYARSAVGERHYAAVLETALLRKRAQYKICDASRFLYDAQSLEQATPTAVARHRAARLAGRRVHDVTCSIGMDLLAAAEVAALAVGSDLDPIRLAMAAHNCRAAGVGTALVRADALHPVTRDTAVLADPARRDATGRRRWRPADFSPPLDELALAHRHADLAVKCAPGVDPADVAWADEIELVSLDGQVREATLWRGGLATPGVRRRASVLRTGAEPGTVTDAQDDTCPVTPPREWIIDPDGAVVRAGLVRHYAAAHGLSQLDEHIAYLTGDTPPPGLRAFQVIEHGHYTEKALRAVLRRLDVGRLEILVRGLDIDPDSLRPRLKLRGDQEASVVLTRIGRAPTALVCRAVWT